MTRFRLTIEYDGRPFMGWQRQPHGPSVQAAIEQAAAAILGEPAVVYAAGRTDAGVHARGMVAHIDIDSPPALAGGAGGGVLHAKETEARFARAHPQPLPQMREGRSWTPFRLLGALNAGLRERGVAIVDCAIANPEFHARFSCVARHYDYLIVNRRAPLTFEAGLAWRISPALDADAMHDAAQILVGRHDFTTFRSAHCQAESPVRTLDRLDVTRDGAIIRVQASARSFLQHQVRSMVGCLSLVGRGKWSADELKSVLEAKDRTALGLNAPPDGLYFMRADYY